jgi:hypothetical protein
MFFETLKYPESSILGPFWSKFSNLVRLMDAAAHHYSASLDTQPCRFIDNSIRRYICQNLTFFIFLHQPPIRDRLAILSFQLFFLS